MVTATHNDIARLIPEIQDHAVVEILAMQATVAEIEAALAALTSGDEDLIDIERRAGDRIHRLAGILSLSQVEAAADRER